LKNRDPNFPSLLVPYNARVSKRKRSATFVLLDCLRMDSCRERIYANLAFLDGEVWVINYYISRISTNDDHEFMNTWMLRERLRQRTTATSELWEDKHKMRNCAKSTSHE